jgi:alkanesulfonate monooxygenase SsuD/methylene tetrahydromethanopterin reductase-like flavin-dependent oxidoreductase (luciferase family)
VPVEIGIELPQVRTSALPSAEELARFAADAEAAGFAGAWVMEPQFGSNLALDPVVTLTVAATATRTIRLGMAVFVLASYQPVRLARAVASLDRLSNGRVIFGVGVGPAGIPWGRFGLRAEERAARTEEYLATMRDLWGDAAFEPKPQQSPFPVWFGGGAPPALRRAVRLGDGWIGAGSSTSAEFAAAAQELDELLEADGRDPASFPVAKRVYLAIDQPEDAVTAWFRGVYGNFAPSLDVVTRGSAEQVAAALAGDELARAGHLILHPVGDERQVDALAEQVLPALRG